MKKSRLLVLFIIVAMILASCDAPGAEPAAPAEPAVEEAAPAEETTEEETTEEEAAPAAPENANLADFTYVGDPGEVFDLNGWYADSGVEADVTIRNPGAVKVPDDMTTPMPTAAEPYTIGFSVYYTVDEVGSMILESMQAAAEEAGVELLVNDANYDQAA